MAQELFGLFLSIDSSIDMRKKLVAVVEKYSLALLLFVMLVFTFRPLLLGNIPFSSNLLVSFFNPWAQEKFPGWTQGIPNKPVGIDDLRIFYPQRKFTNEMLSNFRIPLWNPYSFSGNFHAGLSETAVFYPLFLLFIIIPQLPLWIFLQILEPIIATVGMYCFLRKFLEKTPSLFGAIVFGFSGVVLVRMVEGLSVGMTLIWLPWVLYGIESYFYKKQVRYVAVSVLALCLSLLAGWFQYTFYIFFISFFYTTFHFVQEKKKNILVYVPFFLVPFFTFFHILPALQALSVSSRSVPIQSLLDGHLMPWYHILTFLNPDLWGNPATYTFFGKSEYKESIVYIGAIPFLVSLFGLYYLRARRVLFFGILGCVGIVLGIDTPLTRAILSIPFPIVSSFLPDRIFLFSTLSMSVLAGYGMQYLMQSKKIAFFLLLFVIVIIGSMLVLINGYAAATMAPDILTKYPFVPLLIQFFHLSGMLGLAFTKNPMQQAVFVKAIILPDGFILIAFFLFCVRKFTKNPFFIFCLFALTILGQIYFAQKYIPWSLSRFIFPENEVFHYLQQHQGLSRFITLGQGYISSDIPLYYGLYSPDGVGSMYIGRYGELVTYVQSQGKAFTPIPRIEIRINPTTQSLFTSRDRYMLRFMQIDSISHVVKQKKETGPEGMSSNGTKNFQLRWENKTWQIFRYTQALPHIFWTNTYAVQKNDDAILRAMFTVSQSPKSIILSQNPPLFIDSHATGKVDVLQYQPQHVVMKTRATGNGLIFISDTYAKEFSATIDGKSVPVLQADYAFRAIAVPKGQHTISMFYDTNPEILAFFISIFSIGCVSFCLLLLRNHFTW